MLIREYKIQINVLTFYPEDVYAMCKRFVMPPRSPQYVTIAGKTVRVVLTNRHPLCKSKI
ncbi:hypothetical protein [Nostoc sp.]|uniref:hypothetical protein n=1 Tax=Nostoc sp. TaxID=1180 RepID=UPI002FFC5D74